MSGDLKKSVLITLLMKVTNLKTATQNIFGNTDKFTDKANAVTKGRIFAYDQVLGYINQELEKIQENDMSRNYEMKPGMYKIKDQFKDLPRDVQEDLWVMISHMCNARNDLTKYMGFDLLNKYYNEPV